MALNVPNTNVNGVFNAGERGFDNVRVELDTGESVVTDELGHYKFDGVSPGQHHVILSLAQFSSPDRMTTPSLGEADLIRSRTGVVNFGVMDFARLMGSVFNDLRFDGRRQADSKGMPMVRLVLDDGKQKRTIESQDGDFEVVDLPPGNYTLTVDPTTVPANYVLPKDSFPVHVSPISTAVQDVPLRAVRSIAATRLQSERNLLWGILLVVSIMGQLKEFGAEEFLGPMATLASFAGGSEILDWRCNGSLVIVEHDAQ